MPSSAEDAPDLSGLIELSRVEHLDLKPVILRVRTDLFLQGAPRDRDGIAAFEALACGLIPTVDDETALVVARKLAPATATPEAVLASLAERGGAVRDTVVALAPALTDTLLTAAAKDGTSFEAALAARADLDRTRQGALSASGGAAVDLALARNTGLSLRADVVGRLVARARTAPELAAALLGRTDLAAADLAPLFLQAGEAQRSAIAQAVEAVAALRPCPPAPREIGAILTGLSGKRDVPGFVSVLAEALGLPGSFLQAVTDASARYELLTLALRAVGLHEEEAVYVFLTLNEAVARSADRVFALVRLFRTTTRPAARDLLSAICDRPLAERTARADAHKPYHAPDAQKPRAPERAPMRPALPGRIRQQGS
ncbi:DUF2336 domain-containing protein [Methylobacterium sp. sgz302541]|uniref:DUF2336 domain-containing protein n=1 Tax=unclassified Methylobacterium TaxID=2615210 RepID=UPI003D3521B2